MACAAAGGARGAIFARVSWSVCLGSWRARGAAGHGTSLAQVPWPVTAGPWPAQGEASNSAVHCLHGSLVNLDLAWLSGQSGSSMACAGRGRKQHEICTSLVVTRVSSNLSCAGRTRLCRPCVLQTTSTPLQRSTTHTRWIQKASFGSFCETASVRKRPFDILCQKSVLFASCFFRKDLF